MDKGAIGRLFRNGRSQAVRLPQAFRLSGDRVRIRRVGRGILIEPLIADVQQWFAALDQGRWQEDDFPARAEQPATPAEDIFE